VRVQIDGAITLLLNGRDSVRSSFAEQEKLSGISTDRAPEKGQSFLKKCRRFIGTYLKDKSLEKKSETDG